MHDAGVVRRETNALFRDLHMDPRRKVDTPEKLVQRPGGCGHRPEDWLSIRSHLESG